MRNLIIAQTSRYESAAGSSVRSFTGNRLFTGNAPEGTKHPLIEMQYDLGGSTVETLAQGTAQGSRIETVNMEFVVHSINQSADQALKIGEALKRLFDKELLTLSSSQNMVDVKRVSDGVLLQIDGNDAWQYSIPYRYEFG